MKTTFRNLCLLGLGLLLIVVLAGASFASPVAAAQQGSPLKLDGDPGTDDFDVTITLVGTVASINADSLLLTDGTKIVLPVGFVLPVGIVPGAVVTVVGVFGNDGFLLLTITLGIVTPTATILAPTSTPYLTPTTLPTIIVTVQPTIPGTAVVTCGSDQTQPVAARLAAAFNVSYAEIMSWHCKGYGFGEIAKAYGLALALSKTDHPQTVAQIFALKASGLGWGQIIHQFGIKPSQLAPGIVINGKSKDKQNGDNNGNNGNNGNGTGNDKDKDKNKDKDKGKGK